MVATKVIKCRDIPGGVSGSVERRSPHPDLAEENILDSDESG
jgi:hypothetical protein